MASFKVTVGQNLGQGQFAIQAGAASDTVASQAAVDDAVGVLVDDGATPTEAHVTDLADAWAVLSAELVVGGVTINVDTSAVPSINALKRSLDAILLLAQGSGKFTP